MEALVAVRGCVRKVVRYACGVTPLSRLNWMRKRAGEAKPKMSAEKERWPAMEAALGMSEVVRWGESLMRSPGPSEDPAAHARWWP